ncbi:MAG TPA: RNA polymerase factor sigma-32 [Polyangia bacterium]|jgi:RNA polymerase sigma-32 factor|nr:RNA polymerase factor sigma-32 [Polyangia bacterium]
MLSPATSRATVSVERQPARKPAARRGTATPPVLRIVDASTERELANLNDNDGAEPSGWSAPVSPSARAIFDLVGLPQEVTPPAPAKSGTTPARRNERSEARDESALAAYLKQLRGYPLLSREEEHDLAVTFRRTGDLTVAARLVTANLRLVVKLAREHSNAHISLLDLIQEGNLGLITAVQKFDPDRGVKLSSYAAWWIRAFILKFTLSNCRLVRIGTTQVQRKLFFNLGHQRAKLEQSGVHVDTKELAASLDVPESQVIEMEIRLGEETRLDAPVRGATGGKGLVGDFVPAPEDQRPDAQMEEGQFRAILRSKLHTFESSLDHRDRDIFQRRLLTDEPVTAVEIAQDFGISRERVRQLEGRLLGRLRRILTDEMGDAVGAA